MNWNLQIQTGQYYLYAKFWLLFSLPIFSRERSLRPTGARPPFHPDRETAAPAPAEAYRRLQREIAATGTAKRRQVGPSAQAFHRDRGQIERI